MSELTPYQLAALRAVNEGRIPAEEALLAKLRRRQLIRRSVFAERPWYLTDEGHRVLAEAQS